MARVRRAWIAYATRAVVSLAIVAIGFGIFSVLFLTKPEPPPPRTDDALPRVRVMETALVDVARQWLGFGTAEAMDSADVPARVTAVVAEISDHIVRGASVSAGDILIALDPTDFEQDIDVLSERIAQLDADLEQVDIEETNLEARLALAKTETEIAQRDLERMLELYRQGDAKEVEVDRIRAAVSAAERLESQIREDLQKLNPRRLRLEAQRRGLAAEKRIAETALARTSIRAPIGGVIEQVDVEEGEQVAAGQRIARIVNLETIEVVVRLPASARLFIRRGDQVRLESTGAELVTWQGEIERIAPDDETESRTFAVYVVVHQNPDDRPLLTPGQFVKAIVTSGASERRVIVPRRSIAGDLMLIVEDGRVTHHRPVIDYYISREFPELGVDGEDYWAVLENSLAPGTLIVLNGGSELAHGAHIREEIVNSAAAAVAANGRSRSGNSTESSEAQGHSQ